MTKDEALNLTFDVQNMASESTYKEQLETKDEPVGWIDSKGYMICVKIDESCRPLYTTPQRTWVGLTEEEIKECFSLTPDQHLPWQIYKRIEIKLKERNT
jgi:hypothetical protein